MTALIAGMEAAAILLSANSSTEYSYGGMGGGGGTNCKQAASEDCGQSSPSALVVDN